MTREPNVRPSRTRKRVRLLAYGFTLLLTVIAVEVVLRAVRFAGTTGIAYQPDSVLGHSLRPGFRGWFRNEGEAFFTVNRDGMPDRERVVRKSPGAFRVAVIGDSFTEAPGIPRDQRFTSIMERQLGACPTLRDRNVEVLTFGASGYGPAHEMLVMQTRVWKYTPDVVLLQLFLANDLRSTVRELNGPDPVPYFTHVNGALELDSASRNLPGARPGLRLTLETHGYKWLRSLHLLQTARAQFRYRAVPQSVEAQRPDSTFGYESGADWQIYLPPNEPAWEQAWQTTEALLRAMKADADAHGARFLVAAFPSAIQVHPDRAIREAFRARLGATADLDYPSVRLTEIGTRQELSVLDLTPAMRGHTEKTQTTLYGFANATLGLGHWNAAGHRYGGEAITRWVCESISR